jgi:hypothetical protein
MAECNMVHAAPVLSNKKLRERVFRAWWDQRPSFYKSSSSYSTDEV